LVLLLRAAPPRLLDPGIARGLIADARHAQTLIDDRISESGLRACPGAT
jgi:hypothetical protein